MGTSSWFRLAIAAIVLGVFSLAAVAADTSKVLGNDKDKDKKDSSSHSNSERSLLVENFDLGFTKVLRWESR